VPVVPRTVAVPITVPCVPGSLEMRAVVPSTLKNTDHIPGWSVMPSRSSGLAGTQSTVSSVTTMSWVCIDSVIGIASCQAVDG
jgi:hypothetical protein